MHFEQQRHDHFVKLATHGPLCAKEEVLDQLLGQSAAPLNALAANGHNQGSCNTPRIDAPVAIETHILHRDQSIDQKLRHLIKAHQHPILIVTGIDAADQGRIEAQQFDGGIVRPPLQSRHPVASKAHP